MNCVWCQSAITQFAGPDRTPNWGRWRCQGCGSMGYVDQPTTQALSQLYDSAWMESGAGGQFAAGATSEQIAGSLVSLSLRKSRRLGICLDYGAGKGRVAEQLAKHGAEHVYAIEPFGPDPDIDGVEWCASWQDLPSESKFDHIFMVEVIEHFLNPIDELERARLRLAEGGWLFITTPNARGLRSRLDGQNWREVQNPTHINLFSYEGLKRLLRKAGFTEIVRLYKPVSYNQTGLRAFGLGLTQLVGIDGGLRILAR